MRITVGNNGRYNFHNASDLSLNIPMDNYIYSRDGKKIVSVELTDSQIKKIKKHFCGIKDCLCGSHPAGYEDIGNGCAIIHLTAEEIREGNHESR